MNSFRNTYHLIALTMAFLMFFTSAGLAIDMHYCGGELKSISFFGKAKTCHDMAGENEAPMKNCPHHKKMMAEKTSCSEDKDCCSNKTVLLQSDQDQKIQTTDFVISKEFKQFLIAYVLVFCMNDFDFKRESANFAHYKPPLIQRDISVLNQVFLL
jgi:hypothetical protein